MQLKLIFKLSLMISFTGPLTGSPTSTSTAGPQLIPEMPIGLIGANKSFFDTFGDMA